MQSVLPQITSSQRFVVWKHDGVVLGVRLVTSFFNPRRVAGQFLREPPAVVISAQSLSAVVNQGGGQTSIRVRKWGCSQVSS